MRPIELDHLACRHHGLVTLQTSGLSHAAWRRAVRSGLLDPLHTGVARLPGTPRTLNQRIAAAVLAAGDGAMASHRTAAMLWGLIPVPAGSDPADTVVVIDVTVPRSRHPRIGDWSIVVHRPTDIDDLHPVTRSDIACTPVVRTLCDLGAVEPSAVAGAVDRAIAGELASFDELELATRRHARSGRGGIPALRRALAMRRRATTARPAFELVPVGGRATEGAARWRR